MLTAVAVIGGAVMVAAILGDATIGAIVAGFFSMANTLLLTHVTRQNRRIEHQGKHLTKVLEAPRQLVFDAEGHPVGTILRLSEEGPQQAQVLRRHTDPEPEELA